jgi:hypothetical protein
MTGNLAALFDHPKTGPVDVVGWSDAGIEALRPDSSIEAADSPIEAWAGRDWRGQRPPVQARDPSSRGLRDALPRFGIRGASFRMLRQERTYHVHSCRIARE